MAHQEHPVEKGSIVRCPSRSTLIVAFVLALATAAIISLRGQISGIALYRGGVADTVGPAVTINVASGQLDPTNATPILFTTIFSEVVLDFATGDVTLSGTAGASSAIVSGSGTTYTVTVSGMTSDGTIIATILAGVAHDAAANPNSASTSTDNTVTYDTTQPTVTINQAAGQADPTEISPIDFTVIFSQAVTGFGNADVTLSGTAGATTVSVTGSGTTYNVAVSGMTLSGTVIATIPEDIAQDAAGNLNLASTSTDNTVTFNIVAPSPPTIVTNLISNSSFEVGSEGWIAYGSFDGANYGSERSTPDRLTATNSVHGSNSIMWRTRLFSPPMYLTNGPYVLTWSGMASASTAVDFDLVNINYQLDPTPSVTLGTSWARYTNTFTVVSNGLYSVKWFRAVDASPTTWLDAVQLQPGSTASAYAPKHVIEFGLATTNIHHILNVASPNHFQLKAWNNGASAPAGAAVQVYDYANTNIMALTTISTNALAAGPTTINVALPNKSGWMRTMLYQTNVNDSWDEMAFFVRPYDVTTTRNTNGLIGTHTQFGSNSVKMAKEAGYHFTRDLSPALCVRWPLLQPTSGAFDWDGPLGANGDVCIQEFAANGLVPWLVLTPGANDGEWNTWATNANGSASINAYSNYCFQVADRYSDTPSNCFYYEIGNEWHNILTPTDFSGDIVGAGLASSNRARFLVAGAQAIRAACASCTIIGISGDALYERTAATITNFTAPEFALFDIFSTHQYPLNGGADNPNLAENDLASSRSALLFMQAITNKVIVNSENGNQGNKGGMLGPLALEEPIYWTFGTNNPEAVRDWGMGQRKIATVGREARQIIRSLGVGMRLSINYTGEDVDDDIWVGNYIAIANEFSGAQRQGSVAQLIAANRFIKNPGLGRPTNVFSTAGIEAYLFTNDLGTVAGMWSADYVERTITPTNSSFGLFDVMGNSLGTNLATFRIGQIPVFLVSGTLSAAQLKATIEQASIATVTDLMGPSISIDASPIGTITAGLTNFFKWTLTDWNKQVWSIGSYGNDHTNNLSRVKFQSADAWINVGQSNHYWKAFTSGTYNLIVEGKDFYNNTNVVTGPAFTIP